MDSGRVVASFFFFILLTGAAYGWCCPDKPVREIAPKIQLPAAITKDPTCNCFKKVIDP